jgi:hypothetical protein
VIGSTGGDAAAFVLPELAGEGVRHHEKGSKPVPPKPMKPELLILKDVPVFIDAPVKIGSEVPFIERSIIAPHVGEHVLDTKRIEADAADDVGRGRSWRQ